MFPEKINATEITFSKVPKSRKTVPYETALSIARLIILNYAPNISSGSEKMLALLFNMNSLWEEYVLVKLKQAAQGTGIEVYGQDSKAFWNGITIRPDVVLKKNDEVVLIIDTKWKNIDQSQPSTHDLRQMYVYNEYWTSKKALLLYPSNNNELNQFSRFEKISEDEHHQCGLGKISVLNSFSQLDDRIGNIILNTIN